MCSRLRASTILTADKMLRHTGTKRSFRHDMRLAVLLCINAGFINAAGFLAFKVLTTNVTGHAAQLAVDLALHEPRSARMVALWLLLFLAGAFLCSLIIGRAGRQRAAAYTIPILIIICLVWFVTVFGGSYGHTLQETELYAGSLLFAMGMQNALVSMISGSVVRTTHLTGMFTDLGIDLSEAVLNRGRTSKVLGRRLVLRLSIIVSFLLGGICGGILFHRHGFRAFYIPIGLLAVALFYDYFRVGLQRMLRQVSK